MVKFTVGEKVLCYEPDLTKAKVLYDSKVMAIVEGNSKRTSRKIIEYLIHFQGWNSSWDRRVNEDFVLKDTDENRQLQKELAEKSQLQIGAYLYRREQKKRTRHMSGSSTETKLRFRGSSEDGSSCSTGTVGRDFCDTDLNQEGVHSPSAISMPSSSQSASQSINDSIAVSLAPAGTTTTTTTMSAAASVTVPSAIAGINVTTTTSTSAAAAAAGMADNDTESYSSYEEEEDRVYLQVGDILKTRLEYDWRMITKQKKLVDLPAKLPVITILENYVKYFSIRAITGSPIDQPRRRNSSAKTEKREKDYDKLTKTISLRKEVADGLRIYFDFTVENHLLYREEKEQAKHLLSKEYLKNFKYINPIVYKAEGGNSNVISCSVGGNSSIITIGNLLAGSQSSTNTSAGGCGSNINTTSGGGGTSTGGDQNIIEEVNAKRRLRSYKTEENEIVFDIELTSKHTTDVGCSASNQIGIGGNSSGTGIGTSSGGGAIGSSHIGSCGLAASGSNLGSNNNLGDKSTISTAQLKQMIPSNIGITSKGKEILENILSWEMLGNEANSVPSMIYGAEHLARLIVKLPEFLNASTIQDEKLKILLKHLDNFIEYLESHIEWFSEQNYKSKNAQPAQISELSSQSSTSEILHQNESIIDENNSSGGSAAPPSSSSGVTTTTGSAAAAAAVVVSHE